MDALLFFSASLEVMGTVDLVTSLVNLQSLYWGGILVPPLDRTLAVHEPHSALNS